VNDIFLTDVCMHATPQEIACGAIFFTSSCLKVPITINNNQNPFWKVFGVDDFRAIQLIITKLIQFYETVPEITWTDIEKTKVKDLLNE